VISTLSNFFRFGAELFQFLREREQRRELREEEELLTKYQREALSLADSGHHSDKQLLTEIVAPRIQRQLERLQSLRPVNRDAD
jgi:hypothetical protein